jgi:hypothetical protein
MDRRKRQEIDVAKQKELAAERQSLQAWQHSLETSRASAGTHLVRMPVLSINAQMQCHRLMRAFG